MIARAERAPALLRFAAPLAWRDDPAIARKLMGFAATEEGSALDMLRAAERATDPRLRRLFLRHGLDEARHAQRFRDTARAIAPNHARTRAHEAVRAERQDLWERFGETRFVAFVYLSESRAAKQFGVLADHFADHGVLGPLFTEIGKDERFHVAYSKQLLDEWRAAGRTREVARALRKVKLSMAWSAWLRAGRRIGDRLIRLLLATLFVTAVAPFGLFARRRPAGWKTQAVSLKTHEDFRRQY